MSYVLSNTSLKPPGPSKLMMGLRSLREGAGSDAEGVRPLGGKGRWGKAGEGLGGGLRVWVGARGGGGGGGCGNGAGGVRPKILGNRAKTPATTGPTVAHISVMGQPF